MKRSTRDLLTLIGGAGAVYGYFVLRDRAQAVTEPETEESSPTFAGTPMVMAPAAGDSGGLFAGFTVEPSLSPTPSVIGDPISGDSYQPPPATSPPRPSPPPRNTYTPPPPRDTYPPPPPRTNYNPPPPPRTNVKTIPPPRR